MTARDSRRIILDAIREHLAASDAHEHAPHDGSSPRARHGSLPVIAPDAVALLPTADMADLPAIFVARAEAVGGRCTRVRGAAEAARAVRAILADADARLVVSSRAPLVDHALGEPADPWRVRSAAELSRSDLFACDAGVTTAQWGIAETGTLVLESARERSRLASLVPPLHIALLSTRCIRATLGDVLAAVDPTLDGAITLITGPSRTSDIELTLAIGVHGPQSLHVVLIDDDSDANQGDYT